jgi:hypothetical protein
MTVIYVKPRAGGRVRMPERGSRPMPAEGSWVPRGDYYERLLISGDVTICEPPAARSPVKNEAAVRQAKSSQSASGRNRSAMES